jgi:sigma-54-interacting transcriptional regulator
VVTGPEDALEAFVRTARSELREPIRSMGCGQALSLDCVSTLIPREVHQLDDVGQRALRAWMNRPDHAATQIVSVTSIPLFALARANRFDRDLYYCLNTICLEMEPPTDRQPSDLS